MSNYESIYDILSIKAVKEAEEDNIPSAQTDDIGVNADDDFSIDTSLDDGSSPEEDMGEAQGENPDVGTEQSGNDDISSEEPGAPVDGGTGTNGEIEEDEEIEANTDIFSSLTAEEQQIKIKELKNLYSNLYSSCDDILERINKLDINEDNLDTISRISTSLYDMKVYISDYLTLVFPNKSYIENDVTFVRFLTIVKSITEILDDIIKKYTKENEKKK